MDRLGYTAMTAASRTMMSLQVRSNNLANVNTPGFRADLERAQAVAVEGYGYDSRHMAVVDNNGVSLAAGPMVATGRDLDFAVKGTGLIVLQDGEGEAYTRQGSMQVDAEGRLTLNGRAVMGEGGPIELPEHERVEIGNAVALECLVRILIYVRQGFRFSKIFCGIGYRPIRDVGCSCACVSWLLLLTAAVIHLDSPMSQFYLHNLVGVF